LLENEAVWFSRLHVLVLFVSVATVYSIGMKLTEQWEVQKWDGFVTSLRL